MKFLDEKGRVFGVINIIDFFVLMVALIFVGILTWGWKIQHAPKTKYLEPKCYYLWDKITNQMMSTEEYEDGRSGYVEFARKYPEHFDKRYELLEH